MVSFIPQTFRINHPNSYFQLRVSYHILDSHPPPKFAECISLKFVLTKIEVKNVRIKLFHLLNSEVRILG